MITKVFKSGNSMAIRIPAGININSKEVEITDLGPKGILISPLKNKDPWELFDEGISELNGDWPEREQGENQKRNDW